jgi:solute carrier family 8 (sodium/calcium exchanger)
MRVVPGVGLGWVGVLALVAVAGAQICNSNDPEGGGLLIPAFSYGAKVKCKGDPKKDVGMIILTHYEPDANSTICGRTHSRAGCLQHGMNRSEPKPLCRWKGTVCVDRPVLWRCDCEEYTNNASIDRDPDSGSFQGCEAPASDPQGGLAVVYLVFLLWTFMGVGIIADVFMEAIAVITSKSQLVEKKDTATGEVEQTELMAWNATVANLTLMALGSSAPEILLSVIEIFSNEFMSGDLGPSTIVGSAAFNMLIIIGICVTCIPKADAATEEEGTRRIADLNVFGITAFFSIFAYVWLMLILMVMTPNVVTFGEALITFILFPILVALAWMADKGYFSKRNTVAPALSIVGYNTEGGHAKTFKPSEVKHLLKSDGHRDAIHADPEQLAREAYYKSKPKSRADYRIDATRALTGSKPHLTEVIHEGGVQLRSWVGFECTDYHVSESRDEITLLVHRSGCIAYEVQLDYKTVAGTATAGADYEHTEGTVIFAEGEAVQSISVPIKSDSYCEMSESFSLTLCEPADHNCELEPGRGMATITIEDNAEPCIIQMAETKDEHEKGHSASYRCFESDGHVLVKVDRTGCCAKPCTVKWSTKEDTATANIDYKAVGEGDNEPGTIEFAAGESSKCAEVFIIDDDQYENDESFTVTLAEPDGAQLGGLRTATVTIVNDDELTDAIERISQLFSLNLDKYKAGGASWKAQFVDAVEMPDGAAAIVSHFINLPWKVAFAFCPPPALCGGWLCFSISLALIGVVTAIIGDVAALFGCAAGFKDEFTAITFVALGTSLPDTFASRAAAIGDKTADASIGNVTGSNSVNVFLGLGMPWLIAAIYWTYAVDGGSGKDYSRWLDYLYAESGLNLDQISDVVDVCGDQSTCFLVPAGDLGFSVIVFSLCGVTCLVSLVLRRKLFGAELGGRLALPFGSFFIFLWFLYVTLSALKIYGVL